VLIKIIILAFVLEIITIITRMIFGSARDRYRKMKLKFKIRIHHGYIGLCLIFIIYIFFPAQQMLLIIGWSLLISDLLHHFIVLPLWVKRTEFPV